MNKIKFLYIIIIVLVATNIGVLFNMYLHRPPHPVREGGPKKIIVEKLGFDKKQEAEYEIIIKQHKSSVKALENKIRKNKDALFALLKTDDTTKKDSLITNLGTFQMEIESAHFKHFEAIKGICTTDQLDKFNELTNELGRLFAPPGMPKKPRK